MHTAGLLYGIGLLIVMGAMFVAIYDTVFKSDVKKDIAGKQGAPVVASVAKRVVIGGLIYVGVIWLFVQLVK